MEYSPSKSVPQFLATVGMRICGRKIRADNVCLMQSNPESWFPEESNSSLCAPSWVAHCLSSHDDSTSVVLTCKPGTVTLNVASKKGPDPQLCAAFTLALETVARDRYRRFISGENVKAGNSGNHDIVIMAIIRHAWKHFLALASSIRDTDADLLERFAALELRWRDVCAPPDSYSSQSKVLQDMAATESIPLSKTSSVCLSRILDLISQLPLLDTDEARLENSRALLSNCKALTKHSPFYQAIMRQTWRSLLSNERDFTFLMNLRRALWQLSFYQTGAETFFHKTLPKIQNFVLDGTISFHSQLLPMAHSREFSFGCDVPVLIRNLLCTFEKPGSYTKEEVAKIAAHLGDLWMKDESISVHVHPEVQLVNFIHANELRDQVLGDALGSNRIPCYLCRTYIQAIPPSNSWQFARGEFVAEDWMLPEENLVGVVDSFKEVWWNKITRIMKWLLEAQRGIAWSQLDLYRHTEPTSI